MGKTKARTARKVPRTSPTENGLASKHDQSNNLSPSYNRERRARIHRERPSTRKSRPKSRITGKQPFEKSPDDDAFLDSPSVIWRRLPFKHRLISFLLGFISLYYALFAKHHHYDREIVAIHADVEDLIRRANATILREKLVEAELPAIFRETTPTPPPSRSQKTVTGKTLGPSTAAAATLPLKAKKRKNMSSAKKKKKRMKRDVLKSTFRTNLTNPSAVGLETGTNDSSADTKAFSIETASSSQNIVASTKGGSTPTEQIVSKPSQSVSNSAIVQQGGANQISIAIGNSSQASNQTGSNAQLPTTGTHPALRGVQEAAAVNAYLDANASQTATGGLGVASNVSGSISISQPLQNYTTSALPTNTTVMPQSSNTQANFTSVPRSALSTTPIAAAAAPAPTKPNANEEHDYSAEFKNLGLADVPQGHVPILNWNYDSVISPKTNEQIFGFGSQFHHIAAYKPFCFEAATGATISFTGTRVCSGFNRTEGWMKQYCDVMREAALRENLLKLQPDKPLEWLTEKEAAIQWVEGLSVVQVLEKNCGNIAHFSGRALFLQHIIDNIAAYAAPPSRIENILIVPTYHIMKRFLYPHNYEFWHQSVLNALIAPAQYTIGTLGNFLYREQKYPFNGVPRVQLLHNFSFSGGIIEDKQFVCFRRAIVPGYLKGRFFVDDVEYPSMKPSLRSTAPGAPVTPRDSLRFRERVSLFLDGTSKFPGMKKEIVLLDRKGGRRVFDNTTRPVVLEMFEKISTEKGYQFKVVSFDDMNFTQQYDTMKTVSIAIGIHGANLVNTMFMPPLAVLFELFPFGFLHEMYANGGNAGLKYFKYQMVSGVPFGGPKKYRTVGQCIELNKACKVHYRDAALKVTDIDLKIMEALLRKAVAWCDERPKSVESKPSPAQTSQQQRRRRLLYIGMNRRRKHRVQRNRQS